MVSLEELRRKYGITENDMEPEVANYIKAHTAIQDLLSEEQIRISFDEQVLKILDKVMEEYQRKINKK